MFSETLAIIDLGTNTFHLLFAEINERDEYRILEKFKEPVKLGEGGTREQKIAAPAFKRGIEALKKFKVIIETKGATKVLAIATSAIRSSSNGSDFVEAARKETGINIRIINGNEEAALIFEGVKSGANLPYREKSLLMDIGGGSVEFVVSYENKPQLLRSLNIGAARLLERFNPSDPIKKKEVDEIEDFLREELRGLIAELKEFNITTLVGSSGSFETVGNMVALQNGDTHSAGNLNNYSFNQFSFARTHSRIIQSDRKKRLKIPGMDSMRVDMMVIGSILINFILAELEIPKVLISLYALKEGILTNFIDEKNKRIRQLIGPTEVNIRAKAIKQLTQKFSANEKHGLQVSSIASMMFEKMSFLHKMGIWEAEMLKYAAVLHDIGYFLNRSGHHKHGQYIINHSNLSGFSYDELVLLGNLIRYHRKSLPTRDHYHFKILPQKDRLIVRTLSGFLRIADRLDQGHRGLIDKIDVEVKKDVIKIIVFAAKNVEMEIQYAMDQVELMEQVFGKKVTIVQESDTEF